jgi:phosphoadenosine phosphosulfate reductase
MKGRDFTVTRDFCDPSIHLQRYTQLEQLSPLRTLRWAVETFGSNLIMTSSFGLNGIALIHMLQATCRDIPIVFVDTGCLFAETLDTKQRVEEAYGVRILTYRPNLEIDLQVTPRDPERCCELRKVQPMRRAMAELRPTAVLNARARFQASTRVHLPIVEWNQRPIRINPLAWWSRAQVEDYIRVHDVPYNPLHDQGYPSIGCRPCTQPVMPGQHVRAGRWSGLDKVECGLWTRPEPERKDLRHVEPSEMARARSMELLPIYQER